MSTQHAKATKTFLADKKNAKWHDETLWLVRQKRDNLSKHIPEWEKLRETARDIKMYSTSHMEELIEEFEKKCHGQWLYRPLRKGCRGVS